MLNGSDTPDLESSASDRHSDASELPFADSHPAPQQGPHPLGNGYAAAAAAGSSVCPPSGPSRTASIRSSAASTEDVFSPRTGQGPTPLLASALSSSSGVSSSHGGHGLVHKQLPTTRPAALAEASLSAPGGAVEGMAGGAQGMGLAGEPSHDCLREWAQGGGLQTHHSAEGLPSLSRPVMSPDPAGEFWPWSCLLSSVCLGELATFVHHCYLHSTHAFPELAHQPHHGALLVLWSMLPRVAAQRVDAIESLNASHDVCLSGSLLPVLQLSAAAPLLQAAAHPA